MIAERLEALKRTKCRTAFDACGEEIIQLGSVTLGVQGGGDRKSLEGTSFL